MVPLTCGAGFRQRSSRPCAFYGARHGPLRCRDHDHEHCDRCGHALGHMAGQQEVQATQANQVTWIIPGIELSPWSFGRLSLDRTKRCINLPDAQALPDGLRRQTGGARPAAPADRKRSVFSWIPEPSQAGKERQKGSPPKTRFLLQINLGAGACRAIWGYGVAPPGHYCIQYRQITERPGVVHVSWA
jgi:hypothetical protein